MIEPTLVFFCPLEVANEIKAYADSQGYVSYVTRRGIGTRRPYYHYHGVKVYTGENRALDTMFILKFSAWYEFTNENYHYALYNNNDKWKHEGKCKLRPGSYSRLL